MKLFYRLIIEETKPGVAGYSDRWKIVINPKYENNVGVFQHEYEHLKQWYVMFLVGIMLSSIVGSWFYQVEGALIGALIGAYPSIWLRRLVYNNCEPYRKWAEVQAFRRQINYLSSPANIQWIIDALVNRYRLNTTEEEIRKLLNEPS